MVGDPYLLILADIQCEVRQLMVAAREARLIVAAREARSAPPVDGPAVFTEFEDRLFVLGQSLELLRSDLNDQESGIAARRVDVEQDIAKCADLIGRVRQRENELRLQTAIVTNYHPYQITVDEAAGVTVVRGSPIAGRPPLEPAPLPAAPNVLLFPDAMTRAVWRLGREPEGSAPGGAA